MKLTNNKILITGGGSGIGLGLVERFVAEGNTVIICGRRQDVLDEAKLKVPDIIVHRCDLESEDDRLELFEWISENHKDLNVLINNAGIQNRMKITEIDFHKRSQQEISINVLAPVQLTSLFLNLQSITTIINVTSGLAFIPLTLAPVYSATKAFLRSYTLSLRRQLMHSGIEVIEIIPPKLNTDLSGIGHHADAPPVNAFIKSVFDQLKDGKQEIGFGTSHDQLVQNNNSIKSTFATINP